MITREQIEAVTGRQLTNLEADNFNLYLDIATARLNSVLNRDVNEFDQLPPDLLPVLAFMFKGVNAQANQMSQNGIASKKIEDYQVNYNGEDYMAGVFAKFADILRRYTVSGEIRHGRTVPVINTHDERGYGV